MLINRKKTAAFLLAVCMACMTTGCGKPSFLPDSTNTEETGGKKQDDGSTDASGEGIAAFQKGKLSESLGMHDDKWEESFAVEADEIKEVRIQTDVVLPDTDHMNTAELEPRALSADIVKETIDMLFDDGKAGVLDEKNYPRWKLENKIKGCEASIAATEKLDNYEPEWVEEDKELIKKYQAQLASATDEMAAPSEYGEGSYWGECNGRKWEMHVYEAVEVGYNLNAGLVDYKDGLVSDTIADCDTLYYSDGEDGAENACTISKEDAIRQAADFLGRLGYHEYELQKAASMKWEAGWNDGREDEEFTEGYIVHFGRAIDDVLVAADSYVEHTVGVREYQDEEAMVCITDAGVINFIVTSPRTLKADSVTAVPLLSFDNICGMAKEYINIRCTTQPEYFQTESLQLLILDHMDLTYMVLNNDEGLAIIPVWRIYNTSFRFNDNYFEGIYMGRNFVENFILINAIDGSEIDYVSEYCRVPSDAEWEE